MAINAVAPWEGILEWVGEAASGTTRTGNEWANVDFALKYQDHQMNEKVIVFQAYGVDRVNKLCSLPVGTPLKVLWWPEANQSRDGRYFPKNTAISISVVKPEAKAVDTNVRRPDYPQQTSVHGTAYVQAPAPTPQPPLPPYDGPADVPSDDLPF